MMIRANVPADACDVEIAVQAARLQVVLQDQHAGTVERVKGGIIVQVEDESREAIARSLTCHLGFLPEN